MDTKIRSGLKGSGFGKSNEAARNMMKTTFSPKKKRGKKIKELSHEDVDKAVDRFLSKGGKVDVLPDTWEQIHQSERMLWGFEG